MEENFFNSVEIIENNGKSEIEIDGIKLRAVSNYEIKRNTDIANLTFSISVPPQNLKFGKD